MVDCDWRVMETDCIVIADDSGDGSDESLPSFSQTSMGIGETTCSLSKRASSGQEFPPSKKTARTPASPEHVYNLTASPSEPSSKASSPFSNDLQVEKVPLNSISVGSRSDVKPFTTSWLSLLIGNC